MRPFFEITHQDGLARQGKLTLGKTPVSGFQLLQLDSLEYDAEGTLSLRMRFCPVNGEEISVQMRFQVGFPPPDQSISTLSSGNEISLFVCTHPFLLGPSMIGRTAAAWQEVRAQVCQAREQIPPEVPVGIIIPAWEDPSILDEYLADWKDWKRLAFVLICFDDHSFRNHRQFLKKWHCILSRLPPDLLRIAWGSISPYYMPLLASLGFDGLTTFSGATFAEKGFVATPYGYYLPKEPAAPSTNRPALVAQTKVIFQELQREIVNRVARGTLRELVEMSTHFENAIATTVRIFDTRHWQQKGASTRLNKVSRLQCTGVEAYSRPELDFYRTRLQQRYRVPAYKKLAVLLPCSAKKPYRFSPSHQKMREAIRRVAKSWHYAIEELIVTSPLGLVPRALEDIYPARFYDVPVTGHWDETEIQISTDLITSILIQCPPEMPVVALAEGGYLQVCERVTQQVQQKIEILTPDPKLVSEAVLTALSSFIFKNLQQSNLTPSDTRPSDAEERYRAIADFQFGLGAGNALFPGRLKVNEPRRGIPQIFDAESKALVATLQPSGYLRPVLEGARRLVAGNIAESGKIIFAGTALSGSNFFAAGVSAVQGDIHPGDFVTIHSQETGDLLATAEAIVDGYIMQRMRAGAVAKLLEKAGGPRK